MCDLIAKIFPWGVEHIGSMPLAGQIALAFAVLAAVVLGHYGIHAAAYSVRRRRKAERFNWLMRWLATFADDEPFDPSWMDEDAYYESLR